MSDMNICIFSGRLGKDPETSYTNSGLCVSKFSIAVNKTTKNKETGEKEESTEWIPCVSFGRIAEVVAEYLTAGRQVNIRGRWNEEKWQDKETNEKRSKVKIYVDELNMVSDGKGKQNGNSAQPSKPKDKPLPKESEIPDAVESPMYNESAVNNDDIPF